jgi:Fe-S-cluster-containing hydrogenase component 2/putative sterol carrier protein
MRLEDHPTVVKVRKSAPVPAPPPPLDAKWLRQVVLDAGADDVGFVEIDRAELSDERPYIEAIFPAARTLISFVTRMNRNPVRSPARWLANVEFHHAGESVNQIARIVVSELQSRGVGAVNPAMGFPMEMARFPDGRIWTVAHKTVVEAAGLGKMGIHRNVIHPVFGNFVLLGTVVIDKRVTEYATALDYNPCLECKLCVAACPVGAISDDGHFNFSACYTHNYREFLSGFTDWVGKIAESKSAAEYRRKVAESESASVWQSLSFSANYKSAYCMAVCPAGEDVISPFLGNRAEYLKEVVKPLQERNEAVYVVRGSDAEAHVKRRFPHKTTRLVSNGFRLQTVKALFQRLALAFQREQSAGLDATYSFTFTGEERLAYTLTIREKTLTVHEGHVGKADVSITADSRTWLEFIYKDRGILWALLTRKIRIRGNPRLLLSFGRCFPS